MNDTIQNLVKFGGLAIFVVMALFAFSSINFTGTLDSVGESITGNAVGIQGNTVQKVKLSFVNYRYVLEPAILTKGVPVELEADMSQVYGCMKDVRIPAFDVSQVLSEENNIIRFTPDKSGTFNIACSMNMGRGTFDVVEKDGTKSNYQEEEESAPAGSCGSGGCGCGG